MKISSNGLHKWKITASIDLRKQIESSVHQVDSATMRANIDTALDVAMTNITRDPLFVGGPRYRYHHLGLLHYVYTCEYFILHYAVDEQRHLIYLRKFVLLED